VDPSWNLQGTFCTDVPFSFSPAYVSTPRLEQKVFSLPGMREKFLAEIPLGRKATPEDISKVVEFFVTDLSDYITGQCLSVCGGAIRF